MEKLIRLQKHLASVGLGSRREVERYIIEGLIKVDGKIAHIGQCVRGNESIKYKDKLVNQEAIESRLIMLNKPLGVVSQR